ncbi:MAG: fibronectin type III-like domain-contianing protein, partial [Lachnospiraceae bacterium]|nr:fibronectin type III-like domain-contianing protein [Lachnospiraceae bacterium]
YPFGHGLSYTEFEYSNLKVSSEKIDRNFYETNDMLQVSVDVKNAGRCPGKEVVQLYMGVDARTMDVRRPVRELKGFRKIALKPGESKRVAFTLTRQAFAIWDKECHAFRVPGGSYRIEIGRSSRDIVLSRNLNAEDEYLPVGKEYNIMTPVCDVRRNPVGAEFLEQVMPMVNAIIERMNYGKVQTEMPYAEMMPKTAGLEAEPLQTIMRMVPQITAEKWDAFFDKINKK